MRKIRAAWLLGIMIAVGAGAGADAFGTPTKVKGRVIGPDGAPIAGADVATLWDFDGSKMRPFGGAKTDADGQFQFEAEFYGQPGALVAVDADRKVGGYVVVDPNKGQSRLLMGLNKLVGEPVKAATIPPVDPVEIKLGPLVRVHGNFFCPELDKPPVWTNVYMMLDAGKIRVSQCGSQTAAFDIRLPPGSYLFNGYGTDEVKGVGKKLELKADQPDLDLGTIHLKASPLGKMYDKEPPPLHITDARGISKDIKLADFRGKWVVLDFWGYWCGPCVGRSLPDLMQIYDEHPDDRDKFIVLAFHDKQAENFEQLDRKLKPIVESTWGGRELPFPILLDATGRTVEEYGIQSWPTTIVINPEGKVVRGGQYALSKALPEIPVSRRLAFAMDKQTGFGMAGGTTLAQFAQYLSKNVHIDIKLDEPALRAAGVAVDTPIPLDIVGQVSLRSWLELALKPLGLVAVPGPEGLVVTTPAPDAAGEPSAVQVKVAGRIGGKLAEPASFHFTKASLTEVAGFFEQRTGENFVLDPADRRAGRLDPKTTVTGAASGIPLRDGLKALLGPIGIEAVVRDEVIILTRPATP